MQKSPTTDTGINNVSALKKEACINFRSSPNFKHMKKYLKSKFEEDMNSAAISMSTECNDKKTEQKNVTVAVQPPLPPNSPPPDSPLSFTLKKEIEDDGYETNNPEQSEDFQEDSTLSSQSEQKEELPDSTRRKRTMCKDFVRNKCTRGTVCIFAHEIDFDQLSGVYKFCKDFENGRCSRRVCYFVHATTFEKENFYRTAKLPPRALEHLNPDNPSDVNNSVASGVPPAYNISQRQIRITMKRSVTSLATTEAYTSTTGAHTMYAPIPPAIGQVEKEWANYECSRPPSDLYGTEPLAKNCKRCELSELRLQWHQTKLAKEVMSVKELDDKIKKVSKIHSQFKNTIKLLAKRRFSVIGEGRSNDSLLSQVQMKLFLAKTLLDNNEETEFEKLPWAEG